MLRDNRSYRIWEVIILNIQKALETNKMRFVENAEDYYRQLLIAHDLCFDEKFLKRLQRQIKAARCVIEN